ncbi:hypothetical protein AMPH_11119 [Acinetobacter baumannii]|nr:hypothetical protein AMPH_11119 [Acinetobacter baumannii]
MFCKASVFALITSTSFSFVAASSSETAVFTAVFSSSVTLSPRSLTALFELEINASASLRAFASSSNLRSSSAFASASLIIASISASDKPEFALIWIDCSLPVLLSFADTFKIPSALISKDTSICGTPRGAGGMSPNWKLPNNLFC